MSVVDETPSKFGDELTSLQRDIICVLSGCGEANGQEVTRAIENYYNTTIDGGRLYPNLDALVERGLVDKTPLTARSNEYELTDAGRRAYRTHQDWQSSWATSDTDEAGIGGGDQ